MLERIERSRVLFWFINIAGIIVFYVLNMFTPYHADDYAYRKSFATGAEIESVQDVIASQIQHFYGRGGRLLGHGLDQMLLMYDKSVFNVINTIVFAIFVLAIYFVVHSKKCSNSFLVLEYAAIFFFAPRGNCLLWQTVACNYFWGTVMILLFFIPYILVFEKKSNIFADKRLNIFSCIMALPLGVMTGNFLEAGDAMLLAGIVLVMLWQKYEKTPIYLWEIMGFVGCLAGYAVLIAAPGNYLRAETVSGILGFDNFLVDIMYRLARETYYMIIHMGWLIFAITLLSIMRKGTKSWKQFAMENKVTVLMALLTILGVYVMTATSAYAERVLLTPVVFGIVAAGYLFKEINCKSNRGLVMCVAVACCVTMGTVGSAALYKSSAEGYILDIRTEMVSPVVTPDRE